jgi:phosphoribosylanthranilate isomerase
MNSKIRIKICGMRDPDNIIQVGELRPDYMGFIFYSKSKRFVGDDFKIPEQLSKSIQRVGVFVNETTDKIFKLTKTHALDMIQLHGEESPSQCAEIKEHGLKIMKVFSIDHHFDFAQVNLYKEYVHYFLFDTKSESYGGSGKTFDWNLLKNYDQEVPFFLSGGLSVENSQGIRALEGMNLHALDVNSGVEILPGLKDMEKIKELKQMHFT